MPLLLTQADIRPLVDDITALDRAVDAVEASLRASHAGECGEAVFAGLTLANGDELGTFFASTAHGPASLRVFPHRTAGTRRNSWLGLRIDGVAGTITAMLAIDDVNPLRTAVPAAVGAKHLAPDGSAVLAVLGSGQQAHAHLRAFSRVMPSLEQVRIWSPTAANRARFGQEAQSWLDCEILVADTAQAAVEDADVITAAGKYEGGQPALESADWVRPGALLVSMTFAGANLLGQGAQLVVPTTKRPELVAAGFSSGFMRGPRPTPPFPVRELGDVLANDVKARDATNQTLVYELAAPYIWDLPIFDWVIDWAVAGGRGTQFDFSS